VQTSGGGATAGALAEREGRQAFNTSSVQTIVDPNRLDGPFSIPFAGADAAAKARVTALVIRHSVVFSATIGSLLFHEARASSSLSRNPS
jgi:hypothetical protein